MKRPSPAEHRVVSPDGTELAWHDLEGDGPPILLCNGLGGSWMSWTHQIRYFEDRYRFLSWDYRGLYRSAPPRDPEAVSIEDHTADALAVLDEAGVERATLIGWSMGVQVALELFRRHPERVSHLVLVNGVAGQVWSSVLNLGFMGEVLPPVIRGIGSVPRFAEAVTRRLVSMPETITWAKRIGLAARTLDDAIFQELAGSFADLDMQLYMRTLDKLGEHDATEVSAARRRGDVGDRRGPGPVHAAFAQAERMARRIPGAELMVVPGGTHYVAVEYPELVNLRIEKFFRERGFE